MDPASIIAGAVATGAAAALKPTAAQAVRDAYAGIVALIKDAYKAHGHIGDSVDHLAKRPEDKHRRAALEDDLRGSGADADVHKRLVDAVSTLVQAVQTDDPGAARSVGVDIGTLCAAVLEFENICAPATGTGVKISEAHIAGTASFKNIGDDSPPKP